jgi:hypothetical protein
METKPTRLLYDPPLSFSLKSRSPEPVGSSFRRRRGKDVLRQGRAFARRKNRYTNVGNCPTRSSTFGHAATGPAA